jgi:hypothetical protein
MPKDVRNLATIEQLPTKEDMIEAFGEEFMESTNKGELVEYEVE